VRIGNAIWAQLSEQRGHLFGWAPVVFAVGISFYFAATHEPLSSDTASIMVAALALIIGGYGLAGLRANLVAEPVLGFRYYGPIEGRIIEIDRSGSDAVRLTLDRVVLARMAPDRTPYTVRVSLHGDQGFIEPEPGQLVILTGHLSPPSGPAEPGGFDFQRMAWFERLGAVGYTRTPVLLARGANEGAAGLRVYRMRTAISEAVQDRLPGPSGAFAAAIMTGDRSGMERDSLDALRASNLAHLLAISGMHMGILAAFIFAAVRSGLALFPYVALRWSTKKIAAVCALLAGAGYLVMSGNSVSTERAFVMVAVMLIAVLFDRRALTLRAVAIAAMIVLVLRPEALFGPGFQMSWLKPVGAVFVSSLVAGLATAPIAAFHFNQIAQYGLIANLLSVPLMGTVVMPAAVLAALLAPIGLEMLGLWIMDLGLRWILAVAQFVSAQEAALRHVPTPPSEVLAMIVGGAIIVVLWRGAPRWVGLAPAAIGFVMWQSVDRPVILVAESGSLIGLMTEMGRDVSKERGEGFVASSWLENDGAPVEQFIAFNRTGLIEDGRTVWADINGTRVLNLRGATALAALRGCGGADIVITNQEADTRTGCDVYEYG